MTQSGLPPLIQAYLAPAAQYLQGWRLLAALVLFPALYFGLYLALSSAIGFVLGLGLMDPDRVDVFFSSLLTGENPEGMIAFLFTFLFGWAALWVVLRLVHRRGLGTVIGRPPRALADFLTGAVLLLVLGGGLFLIASSWILPAVVLHHDPGLWLTLLPLALLGILIQTGAEEAVFRGWLLQELGLRFGRWVAVLIPSVIFGLMHLGNGDGEISGWLMVFATGLFGFVAADLTWRTGSLGLAWGLHFSNNLLALLIYSSTPALDGLALFRPAFEVPGNLNALVVFDVFSTLVIWGACLLVLRRR